MCRLMDSTDKTSNVGLIQQATVVYVEKLQPNSCPVKARNLDSRDILLKGQEQSSKENKKDTSYFATQPDLLFPFAKTLFAFEWCKVN